MPYFEKTRTSTLYAEFTQDYTVQARQSGLNEIPDDNVDPLKFTNWNFGGHLGFSATCSFVTISSYAFNGGGPITAGIWDAKLVLRVVSNNGAGTITTQDIVIDEVFNLPANQQKHYFSGSIIGKHEASVETDVLWDISEAADPKIIEYAIFPRYTTYRWYEMSTKGSTAQITTTVTGKGSASASGAVGFRNVANYTATLGADSRITGPGSHSFSLIKVKVNDILLYTPAFSHVFEGLSTGPWNINLIANALQSSSGSLSTSVCLTRKCDIAGVIRSWKGVYNNKVDIDIFGFDKILGYKRISAGSSGEFSANKTMNRWSVSSFLSRNGFNSQTKFDSLDEVPEYISAGLVLSSLDGGDVFTAPDALWVRWRGFRFSGATISQDPTYTITQTGNDRLYNPYPNFSGYRFLDIQVKSLSGNQKATIEITEQPGDIIKTYSVSTDSTTYVTKTIDLCSPQNIFVETDTQDDPYPRLNLNNNFAPEQEGKNLAYYGVSRVSRLRVKNNTDVQIGTTILRKDLFNEFNLIPSGYHHRASRVTDAQVSEIGTITNYYTRRFWQQNTDARDEEESDVWWQKTTGGKTEVASYSLQARTIQNLVNDITATDTYPVGGAYVRHTGWKATNLLAQGSNCNVEQPPLRNCFLNGETGYATWLHGGGILALPDKDKSSHTSYTYGFDRTHGAQVAQTIFNRINGDFIPDIPDPFDVVAFLNPADEDGLYLRGGVIIRGTSHGILFDLQSNPIFSQTDPVEIFLEPDGTSRGSDLPDVLGTYETGYPYAKGDRDHTSKFKKLSAPINPIRWAKKHRVVYKGKKTIINNLHAAESIHTKEILVAYNSNSATADPKGEIEILSVNNVENEFYYNYVIQDESGNKFLGTSPFVINSNTVKNDNNGIFAIISDYDNKPNPKDEDYLYYNNQSLITASFSTLHESNWYPLVAGALDETGFSVKSKIYENLIFNSFALSDVPEVKNIGIASKGSLIYRSIQLNEAYTETSGPNNIILVEGPSPEKIDLFTNIIIPDSPFTDPVASTYHGILNLKTNDVLFLYILENSASKIYFKTLVANNLSQRGLLLDLVDISGVATYEYDLSNLSMTYDTKTNMAKFVFFVKGNIYYGEVSMSSYETNNISFQSRLHFVAGLYDPGDAFIKGLITNEYLFDDENSLKNVEITPQRVGIISTQNSMQDGEVFVWYKNIDDNIQMIRFEPYKRNISNREFVLQ